MGASVEGNDGVGEAIARLAGEVATHPERRHARFTVATTWKGGVRSDSRVAMREIGGRKLPADFILRVDEPELFGGADTAPSPHELLLAAVNACLIAGFAAACAREGIVLRQLVVTTRSDVDLGDALGVSPQAAPCQRMSSTWRVSADAPESALRALHEGVVSRSPNGWCLSRSIALESQLVLD